MYNTEESSSLKPSLVLSEEVSGSEGLLCCRSCFPAAPLGWAPGSAPCVLLASARALGMVDDPVEGICEAFWKCDCQGQPADFTVGRSEQQSPA